MIDFECLACGSHEYRIISSGAIAQCKNCNAVWDVGLFETRGVEIDDDDEEDE
jgi:ribosomal protein L37AE/L43A